MLILRKQGYCAHGRENASPSGLSPSAGGRYGPSSRLGTAGARGFGRLSTEMISPKRVLRPSQGGQHREGSRHGGRSGGRRRDGAVRPRHDRGTGRPCRLARHDGGEPAGADMGRELAGVSLGEIEQATKKLTTRLSRSRGRVVVVDCTVQRAPCCSPRSGCPSTGGSGRKPARVRRHLRRLTLTPTARC